MIHGKVYSFFSQIAFYPMLKRSNNSSKLGNLACVILTLTESSITANTYNFLSMCPFIHKSTHLPVICLFIYLLIFLSSIQRMARHAMVKFWNIILLTTFPNYKPWVPSRSSCILCLPSYIHKAFLIGMEKKNKGSEIPDLDLNP